MTLTRKLGNYTLDIVDIEDFKHYYEENKEAFSASALNSYLKAVDIPPKFFKEQPEETQEELLDNREIFVRERKKFFNKVIVVLKSDMSILNACRLDKRDEEVAYEKLKDIDEVSNKFEHRSFIKDGYISLIVSEDIKRDVENQVLAIDFPILMNKKVVIHKALYTLPADNAIVPIEHIEYLTSEEIDLDVDYNSVKAAVEDRLDFISDKNRKEAEPEVILREPEVVGLALVQLETIPRSYLEKVTTHIKDNTKGDLTTKTLEDLVLDFDEELRSYKQVTKLREVSGFAVKSVLESPTFTEFLEEMESIKEDKEDKEEKELMYC